MTKVISIVNHKGGVGKTTSSVNIGSGLTLLKKKVLLIDLDPQANLTVNFGLSLDEPENIYKALRGKSALPIIKLSNGVDVVPSTLDLSAADIELNNEPAREYILKRLIKPIKSNYDYILIDCPPSLGLLTLNALSVSEEVIIPIDLARFALIGMTKIFEVIGKVKDVLNPDLKDFSILMTKQDKRTTIHKDISDSIIEHYNDKVFNTIIRKNVAIEEAQMQGLDIFSYNPTCTAALDYLDVCKELIKK